jgi:hypothetical protein
VKSSITIHDPYSYCSSTFADQVDVSEHPEFSALLGPDGKPLRYRQPDPIGFRLRPTVKAREDE